MTEDNEQKPEAPAESESLTDYPADDANLFKRILWVRERVTRLGKDSQVGTGGNQSYKAISHDKVTAFIRPKMTQAGIMSVLSCLEVSDAETGAVTSKGRKIVQHRAKFQISFINVHNTTEAIDIIQMAYADDYGDKAPGKAASYAMKYALLKMFMIETGEEDETRIETDGGRIAVIIDDEKMTADIWAVAEECFGEDDAKIMLKAMAERRFFVSSYGEIPQDRYADAVRSLRKKAESMTKENN